MAGVGVTGHSQSRRRPAGMSQDTPIPLSAAVDQLKTFNAVNVSVGILLKPDRTGQDVQSGFFRFAMRRRAKSSKKAGIVS